MRWSAPGFIIVVLLSATAHAQFPQAPPDRPLPPPPPMPALVSPAPPIRPASSQPINALRQDENTLAQIDHSLPLTKQVDQSIELAVNYLLKHQRDNGSWGGQMLAVNDGDDIGETALATLALLSCGVSHQSPELVKAIDFLKKSHPENIHNATYSIALRAAVYAQLPESTRKPELAADLRWLQEALIRRGATAGMYTYGKNSSNNYWQGGDFSNSQYGVLGCWYAEMAGLEVPTRYWTQVEDCWKTGQNPDGGWGYNMADGDSYASMTAAGIATLYITYDYIHSREEVNLNKVIATPAIDKAIHWLGQNFAVDINSGRDNRAQLEQLGNAQSDALNNALGGAPQHIRMIGSWVHYMLFGYERVGEASGLTRFGTYKWFDEGAKFLIDTQNSDGSWNSQPDKYVGTSYALLFLARGRSPVALQKLQFKGRWDNRSRDCASIVKWLTRETERHTNWQILPVEASPMEMREAPILYVASDKPLLLRESDKQRIKTYIDQGGLLLAVNEGVNKGFADSVVQLAHEMYPAYEFRTLPTDHIIYSENFPVKNLPTQPKALGNGVRELMVLLPSGDMSWKFQMGAGTNNPTLAPVFSFIGNLYIYMNDKANPRFKGDDTWIEADPGIDDKAQVNLARLKFNANWNPEPLGWTRLSNVLHNRDSIKLNLLQIDLNTMLLESSNAIAHMTATNSFDLTKIQLDTIKKYLDNGGVLLFDAAGGSPDAQISFETMIGKLYPTAKLKPLDIASPIYTGEGFGGAKITQVTYRRFANDRIGKTTLPRLRALEVKGKIVAIDSPEDLSAGLVGYNIDGIVGYSPASATEIVRNIVLWARSKHG